VIASMLRDAIAMQERFDVGALVVLATVAATAARACSSRMR